MITCSRSQAKWIPRNFPEDLRADCLVKCDTHTHTLTYTTLGLFHLAYFAWPFTSPDRLAVRLRKPDYINSSSISSYSSFIFRGIHYAHNNRESIDLLIVLLPDQERVFVRASTHQSARRVHEIALP